MGRDRESGVPDAPSPSAESTSGRRSSFSFLSRSKSTERLKVMEAAKAGKSKDMKPKRSFSNGNRLVKKHIQREVEEVLRQAKEDIPQVPPTIPTITHQPQLQTFGGEHARPSTEQTRPRSSSAVKQSIDMGRNNVPVPPVPEQYRPESADQYNRSESMTNRGRYSYASSFVSVSGPRRVRRRKDPTPFNILVLGAASTGKTSFIDFLRTSCALPAKKQRMSMQRLNGLPDEQVKQTSSSPAFTCEYLETEMSDGERIGLTLWDSESLEKNVVDLQLREITTFIESKFEETYSEENKLVRSPGFRDTHIHCAFLVLDPRRLDLTVSAAQKALLRANPSNGRARAKDLNMSGDVRILDEALDLQVMRVLQGKTAVIPVISKADTVTSTHMQTLKRSVWNVLKRSGLDPLEAIGIELDDDSDDSDLYEVDDEDEALVEMETTLGVPPNKASSSKSVSPARSTKTEDSDLIDKTPPSKDGEVDLPPLPLSIMTPDPPDIHHNEAEKMPGNVGRAFPWGFADPYDPSHCDFVRLKEVVLGNWRAELRQKSREVWYENWRTARLKGSRLPLRDGPNIRTAQPAGGSRSNMRAAAAVPAPMTSRTGPSGAAPSIPPGPPLASNAVRGALPASLVPGGSGGPSVGGVGKPANGDRNLVHRSGAAGPPPAGPPAPPLKSNINMPTLSPPQAAKAAGVLQMSAARVHSAQPAATAPLSSSPPDRAAPSSVAGRLRETASPSSSRTQRDPVTALPQVKADEVGLAR